MKDTLAPALHIIKSIFHNSRITKSDMTRAHLLESDFQGSVLFKCYLNEADLSDSIFTECDLSHSDLEGCNVTRADFTDADLSHTGLEDIAHMIAGGRPDPLSFFINALKLDIDAPRCPSTLRIQIKEKLENLGAAVSELAGTQICKTPAETVTRAVNSLYEYPEKQELAQRLLIECILECINMINPTSDAAPEDN
jgi:uncharacterized protein YjbI with pentapeptide repeats